MATTNTQRRRISIDLPIYAIGRLDQLAKENHVSRKSFLESYLLDSLYHEPNEVTLAAMKEAEEGINLEPLDAYHFREYLETL